MAHETATDQKGVFYLRPLFYPADSIFMKYGLSASNFKVKYETFLNPFHPKVVDLRLDDPYWNDPGAQYDPWYGPNYYYYYRYRNHKSIFDVAKIVDRNDTHYVVSQNKDLTPG